MDGRLKDLGETMNVQVVYFIMRYFGYYVYNSKGKNPKKSCGKNE